jgi:hypothetical protein
MHFPRRDELDVNLAAGTTVFDRYCLVTSRWIHDRIC